MRFMHKKEADVFDKQISNREVAVMLLGLGEKADLCVAPSDHERPMFNEYVMEDAVLPRSYAC